MLMTTLKKLTGKANLWTSLGHGICQRRFSLINVVFYSPLSLSIVTASRVIGPTLGSLLGSACLATYVDPGNAPDGLKEGDPRWLGAWWVGFVIIAALLMCFAPWLTLFPARLRANEVTDAEKVQQELEGEDEPKTLKEWLAESKAVATRLASSKVSLERLNEASRNVKMT